MPKRNSSLVLILAFSAVLAGCAPECVGPEFNTKGDTESGSLSDSLYLGASPNPFCNGTCIVYYTPVTAKILLNISDENEEILETLVDEERKTGYYRIRFDSEDLEAGIYFATFMVSGCGEVSAKLVLVR